jgi:hypothetical protein
VRDARLRLDGYSAFFDDPANGLVFVTHRVPGCGTTLTLYAGQLRVLFSGTDYPELHKGADDCHRLCLDRSRLEECDAECSMAWVRDVLQYLRRHEMPDDGAAAATADE